MTDAIRIAGLGKKYRIRHDRGGHTYLALRDVIAARAARLFGLSAEARSAKVEAARGLAARA